MSSINEVGNNKKTGTLKIYYIAVIIYVLPLLSLGLFIVDQLTVNKTEMLFWVLFLVGLFPCGVLGLVFSIIGFRKSKRLKSKRNKVIGSIGIWGGAVSLIAGIFGVMLIYVVVGA